VDGELFIGGLQLSPGYYGTPMASLGILIKSGPPVAYVIGIPIGAQVSLLVSVPLISKQRIIRSSHFPPNASIK